MNKIINLLEDELMENFKRGTNEQINKFTSILHSLPYESILETAETILMGGHIISDKSQGFLGTSRKVYILPGYKVLKLAYSKDQRDPELQYRGAGADQNEAEVKIWNTVGDKEILAEIYDYDNRNYDWIIMEYAKVARRMIIEEKNKKIKERYNLDSYADLFSVIGNIASLEGNRSFVSKGNQYWNDLLGKPPIKNWVEFKKKISNFEGDLNEDNMGFTKDGRFVSIDYGFTSEVLFNHYR